MNTINWRDQTIERLEKDVWPALSDLDKQDWLIVECNALRKKPIKDFTLENLRQMIEQNMGLEFLIPVALEEIEKNILAHGDNYPGDLLMNLLTCEAMYWEQHKDHWNTVKTLFTENVGLLKHADTTWEIRKGWFDNFKLFSKIN
jgi:CDI immunity proteins